ncbi:MAG: Gfo/Idh/MocA family oxidoreductase [Kyrpidia tusciae]|nr:Gfo/Idh/MocA family oxidoreductase [Kyrpidia tusciae]MBE3552248.1 Gfo/Idh/MocA family oxidoreductase [Kyrpidia tusciae]
MNPVRMAVLSGAHVHADTYVSTLRQLPGAELVGIWDHVLHRGRDLAERHGVLFEADLDRLLERCDGVVVAAENSRHYPVVLAALRAGKHVLCEKPLAGAASRARDLAARAQRLGRVLAVAFAVRFSPAALRLKMLMHNGALGALVAAVGANCGKMPGGWFAQKGYGGGAIWDHAVHLIDLLRWMTGDEVKSVFARSATLFHPDIEVEDAAHLQLRFSRGWIAGLDPSWSRPASYPTWGGLQLRLVGEKGTAEMDVFSEFVKEYGEQGVHRRIYGDDPYGCMVEAFVEAVRAGRMPPESLLAPAEDGWAVERVVEAAYRSARIGREVGL